MKLANETHFILEQLNSWLLTEIFKVFNLEVFYILKVVNEIELAVDGS